MYAIIEDSGQQFKVCEGDTLQVDLRPLEEGQSQIEFDRVLLVSGDGKVQVGTPLVKGAKVVAEVLVGLSAGPKLYHWDFRRRKSSRRKIGHRQKYVRVRISKIVA